VSPPVLWHIPVSHYNEKVRWALELKGVEHERRAPPPHPDPPLYPEAPAELQRALELEEFFDEELGPYSRLLAFHHLRQDAGARAAFAGSMLPGPLAGNGTARRLAGHFASVYSKARYRAGDDDAAARAHAKVVAAFDRLEAELHRNGGSEYLVGGSFSVADLTAASLFLPIVLPPEGPELPDPTEAYQAVREPLADRPGYRWVAGIFARHRGAARRP
jgi:glutathione S-transferase